MAEVGVETAVHGQLSEFGLDLEGTLAPGVPLTEEDVEQLQSARALLDEQPPASAAALARVRELFAAGKYDIRALFIGLLSLTRAVPVVGALRALEVLGLFLERHWASFGPASEDRKRKLFGALCGALFEGLSAALRAALHGGQLRVLVAGFPEGARAAYWTALLERIEQQLNARELSVPAPRLRALRDDVQSLSQALEAPAEREQPASPALARALATSLSAPAAVPEFEATSAQVGGEVTLRASARFFELESKLRAFELLAARGDDLKAALVSRDVLALIEGFDPRLYFPALFVGFFQTLAARAERLAAVEAELESPSSRALEQLYRLDLGCFVAALRSERGSRA